jgi:hypothetical protein
MRTISVTLFGKINLHCIKDIIPFVYADDKYEEEIVVTFCSKSLKNRHFWADCSKFLAINKD